uniref:Nucleoporin NSP1-like C-terminal domain-containing protein n=1 Tax=Haptolina ericina TaxID=156174 RepID=A0A7S3BT10_9EUKA
MDHFHTKLGEQVNSFTKQAGEIDKWDRALIQQRDRALQLHDTTTRLQQGATAINTELELILQHQDEMHNALTVLEKKVENEARQFADRPSDRQQAYALVESLDKELSETKDLLSDTVDRLNKQRHTESAKDSEQAALAQMVSVLDVHLNAFLWLEQQSNQLEEALGQVDALATDQQALQRMRPFDDPMR